jgi:hypothetical protein
MELICFVFGKTLKNYKPQRGNSVGSEPQCAAKCDTNFQWGNDRLTEETNMVGSFFVGLDY